MIDHSSRAGRWIAAGFVLFTITGLLHAEFNWPRWRGPEGTGHAAETGLPVKWDAGSIVWKTSLKGRGHSSPIIWGERIFLTTALDEGKQRVVFCVDRNNGKVLWEQVAWTGEPEPSRPENGWASASCCTDGERVVAFFGKGGLHCYSVEGKPLWSRTDLGPFLGPWGTAASPVMVGDLVIQNCDAQQEAYLLAVDRRTGKTVWKTPRDVPENGGWSTPVLVDSSGRRELVLNGESWVTAYEPATGKRLWWCKTFVGRGEPTVLAANGLVYVVSGLRDNMFAVRPGGTGDVTKTHIVWQAPRLVGRDQPSPTLAGDCLFVTNMDGILTAYDPASGKELWKDRLDGRFFSSPVVAGGMVYFQSESGETFVLEPGPAMKVVARNSLAAPADEQFHASLTPSDGQFFARSDQTLYCIGTRRSKVGK